MNSGSNLDNSSAVSSASLYVGDLAPEVNEALLFEIFNAVGPVASIRVCRDALTARSLGYAYVNFHNVHDAERALDSLNFTNIANHPCRIMWSQRDPSLRKSGVGNIFVKNLDPSIDHKTLYDTFSVFGDILSCKVVTDRNGESLGYGFVHYETAEDAQKAIDNVNGMLIADNEVIVQPFKPKSQRHSGEQPLFTNLYVKHLPDDYKQNDFEELFSHYGEITSLMLAVDYNGQPKGFGFVNFANHDDAVEAIEGLNGHIFDDAKPPLYVSRAMKKNERAKYLKDAREKRSQELQQRWAGCNLYVKNLADSIDDEMLREEFSPFGEIESVKVQRDPETAMSKGFGFVCFTTPEDANRALGEMNGRIWMKKPLYVALFQNKETRRANLEAQYAHRRNMGVPAMYPAAAVNQMYYQGQPMVYPAMAPSYHRPQAPMRGYAQEQRAPKQQPRGRPQAVLASGPAPLTLQALAAASPEEQRQMIGERLFPKIQAMEPKRAGKVTGMLLEMDNSDLLELLESDEMLQAKVLEAIDVLDQYV